MHDSKNIPNIQPQRLIQNPIKHYDWGSTDSNSIIRKLSNVQKQNQTCAELWMGVHPNGESKCSNSLNSLSDYLSQKNLPSIQFLFKVLSIEKCLSVQIHPNQIQAQYLHKTNSSVYKDPNSKPEMFIPISQKFQCFFGFISEDKARQILEEPTLKKILSKFTSIPEIIVHLFYISPEQAKELLCNYWKVLENVYPNRINLYKRLQSQFPNDIGLIVTLFLEYHIVNKYQCFYIAPHTPHAYIQGECLEIMKNSDNVVRLGLTPKFVDIENIRRLLLKEKTQINQSIQIIAELKEENYFYQKNGLNISIIMKANNLLYNTDGYIQIALILSGQFLVQQSRQKVREFQGSDQRYQQQKKFTPRQKGTIYLLQSSKQYRITGNGQLCIGWSSF